MTRGREFGLREKDLSLVGSKDSQEQGWLQDFCAGKATGWPLGRLYRELESAGSAGQARLCGSGHLLIQACGAVGNYRRG